MQVYYYALSIGSLGGILLWIILTAQFLLPVSLRVNLLDPFTVALVLVAAGVGMLTMSKAIPVLKTITDAVVVSGLAGAVTGFVMGTVNSVAGSIFSTHEADMLLLSLLVNICITLFYTMMIGVFAALFGILYVKVRKACKL
jgi:hypothetical protein